MFPIKPNSPITPNLYIEPTVTQTRGTMNLDAPGTSRKHDHPTPKRLILKITTKGRELHRSKSSNRNSTELKETFVNPNFAIDINTSVVDQNGIGSVYFTRPELQTKKKQIINKKKKPQSPIIVSGQKSEKSTPIAIEAKRSTENIGVPALYETVEPTFFYKLNDVLGQTDPSKRTNPNTLARTVTGAQSRKTLHNAAFNMALFEVAAKSNIAKRSNSFKSKPKQERKTVSRSKKQSMTLEEALQALSLGEVPFDQNPNSHPIALTGKAFKLTPTNPFPLPKKQNSTNSYSKKSVSKSKGLHKSKSTSTSVKSSLAAPPKQLHTSEGAKNNNTNQTFVPLKLQDVFNSKSNPTATIQPLIQAIEPQEKRVKKQLRFADAGRVPLETQLFGRPDPLGKVLEELNSHQTSNL